MYFSEAVCMLVLQISNSETVLQHLVLITLDEINHSFIPHMLSVMSPYLIVRAVQ